MFGLSLLATLVMLPLIFARLVTGGPLPLALTPTLFLVLGPLGQSTTAVNKFADAAAGRRPGPLRQGFDVFAVLYGVPVMGFALLWLALAAAHGRAGPAARHGLRDDLVGVHLPRGHLCHGRGGPGPAHRPRGLRLAGRRPVRRPGGGLGAGRCHTARGLLSGKLLATPPQK